MKSIVWFAALSAAASLSSAQADQVFRGFDVGNGSTALPSFPSSSAAQTSFLAALPGASGEQDFESFTTNQSAPGLWSFGGGISATFTNQSTVTSSVQSGLSAVGTYAAQGQRYLYAETAPGSGFLTLTFNQPISAIGFFLGDASDWIGEANAPGPLFIELRGANANLISTTDLTSGLLISQNPSHGMAYFGIVSDTPFTSIRIAQPLRATGSNAGSDGIGIDQITVAIPAPSAACALALVGLVGSRRRRA